MAELDRVRASPVLFGDAPYRCAGWLHGEHDDVGVILCQPLGAEGESAHRSLLHLAYGLARRGVRVLRFDYPGSGDSEGESFDCARLPAWLDSIDQAAQFLRSVAGCRNIGLIGLRLGGALAGMASARVGAQWLALWAPVSSGRAYARELRAVAALGITQERTDRAVEVAGHRYASDFVDSIATLRAEDWDLSGLRRILLLERDDARPDEKLRIVLQASGCALDVRSFAGYPALFDRPQDSRVPETAIEALCDWVAGSVGAARASTASTVPCASAGIAQVPVPTLDTGIYREHRLMLGQTRCMVGVLCEPAPPAANDAPLVLWINAGAVHHAGPGRLYVRHARILAAQGVASLRVDLSVLGDSIVPGATDENDCYAESCRHDVLDIVRDARDRLGFRDLIPAGLCSGAYWSLQLAIDPRIQGLRAVAMINPLAIGKHPDAGWAVGSDASEAMRYRDALRKWSSWKKVLTFRAHVGTAIAVLARRGISRVGTALRQVKRRLHRLPPDALGHGLQRLREQHTPLGLFVGRAEPGYHLLKQEAPRELRTGLRTSMVRVFPLPDCDHTFTTEAAKQRLFRTFGEFIESVRNP